ncbi:hypothetical protein CS542_09195, partial [Pedobacter sp. IW39]
EFCDCDQTYVDLLQIYHSQIWPCRKKIVLTFDDGPDPVYTPQIIVMISYKRKRYQAASLW